MEIYGVKLLERIEKGLFGYLLKFVSEKEKARIKKFRRWEDAHRVLLADLLIRHIIIEKTGLKNENISFCLNKYGKPFLNNREDFHFNLSHSGIWVVCAIDSRPIGIDVEKIVPIDLDTSKDFFTNEEHSDLMSKDEYEKLPYFYTLWTLKESYIKAVGKGLSIPFKSFSIKAEKDQNIILKVNNKIRDDRYFIKYNLDFDYKLSVCALNNKFPAFIIINPVQQLFT